MCLCCVILEEAAKRSLLVQWNVGIKYFKTGRLSDHTGSYNTKLDENITIEPGNFMNCTQWWERSYRVISTMKTSEREHRKCFQFMKANCLHSLMFNTSTCFLQRKQANFHKCKTTEPTSWQRQQTCNFTQGTKFPQKTCVPKGAGKERYTNRDNQERIST